MIKNIFTYLRHIDDRLGIQKWLIVVLSVSLILRIPSFFEPYSYGDEMIYLALGEGVRGGLTLFKDLHDNKPPLLYWAAALAGSLFWFKVILAFFNLLSIILFAKLAEKLFQDKILIVRVATWIFAIFTTIPLLEGNIVNAELFMITFTLAAFLLLISKQNSFKVLFFAGVLFSFGALFKIPSAFDMLTLPAFWVITLGLKKESLGKIIKSSLILFFGFAVPILTTFIWYWAKGALNEYVIAAFMQNVGYLSSFRPGDVQKPFLEKNLPILIRSSIVAITCLVLYFSRKRLSRNFIFVTLWLVFGLFGVTLSERPYPHYLIQVIAPVSILLGMLVGVRSLEQSLTIIPLSLFFFVPVYFNYWHYPTLSYYVRFVKFATKQIDKEAYLASFDSKVLRNYEISKFLNESTNRNDKVFIWEDGSVIYALSRRLPPGKYVAGYHIRDFSTKEETVRLLENSKPKTIVILPEAETFPEIQSLLKKEYTKLQMFQHVQIYRLKK